MREVKIVLTSDGRSMIGRPSLCIVALQGALRLSLYYTVRISFSLAAKSSSIFFMNLSWIF